MIYIFWSCKDSAEAKKIIHLLLEKKLIACASIFPIESIYRWEGKIEEGQEVKVILKTEARHFEAAKNLIQKECSYEVPEIVQVDITNGNSSYLSWIAQSL